ncbi:hypothetical protein [Streptomyces sp. NPDC017958]|uniref:hypothetical protein n=1 Tax=Streptomyces sp. NPDC017958 TaxID=3365021 RepID=UPI003796188A
MEGWKFWWGIAAFFLGGLATQLNGWLAYRRQRADKVAESADALKQRREEFELQHLVEVNKLLRECMACCAGLLILQWRNDTLPDHRVTEEMREEQRVAERAHTVAEGELHSQIGFVFDDQVRQKIKQAAAYMSQASAHPTEGTDRSAVLLTMHNTVNSAYEALTARVRALYAGRATPR